MQKAIARLLRRLGVPAASPVPREEIIAAIAALNALTAVLDAMSAGLDDSAKSLRAAGDAISGAAQ